MGKYSFAHRIRSKGLILSLALLTGCVSNGYMPPQEKIVVRVYNEFSWNSVTVTFFCNGSQRGLRIKNVELGEIKNQTFTGPCISPHFEVSYFTTNTGWRSQIQNAGRVSRWCVYIKNQPSLTVVIPCGYLLPV